MASRWPERLWIVRHGESAGNVARAAALASGAVEIAIAERDVDVPLSALGEEQAAALGRWFAAMADEERPDVLIASPYARARRTSALIRDAGAMAPDPCPTIVDERLREKEFGVLDRLTKDGVIARFPDQAEFRRLLGKFYHRPPGGESWCDVILRLRSALDTISLHYAGRRVLIVGHQVVVLCMRYLIEQMTEADILAIDAERDVANCGVTEYARVTEQGEERLELIRYNFVAPLTAQGAPVTTAPDVPVAAR